MYIRKLDSPFQRQVITAEFKLGGKKKLSLKSQEAKQKFIWAVNSLQRRIATVENKKCSFTLYVFTEGTLYVN